MLGFAARRPKGDGAGLVWFGLYEEGPRQTPLNGLTGLTNGPPWLEPLRLERSDF
jgi:hypothetical protein